MTSGARLRRIAGRSLFVAPVCAWLVMTSAASAQSSSGNLSPRLAELAKPAVRTASLAEQAAALSVAPRGPGSLLRRGNRVLVDVRFDSGAAAGLGALRAAGAQVVHLSRRYQTVTVAVAPSGFHELAEAPRVQGVTEDLAPIVYGAGGSPPVTSTANPCFGAATSEGDLQLNAMAARDAFSVDGGGVTIGILSDTFNKDATAPTHAAQDIASGDLPGPGNPCGHTTPVNVLSDPNAIVDSNPTDEGRAMAQIVHDLAPGAALSFATAYPNDQAFADNIDALANAGAKVIVDDISYYDEPFFQKGPVGIAVSDVTAKGVTYFSAAGNNNLVGAGLHDIASWEALSFRDSPSCPSALTAFADHCMDFDPGASVDNTFGITVSSGATLTVDLQWAQPWNGVTTDLDAFLLDSNGDLLDDGGLTVGSFDDNVGNTQKPFEAFQWENATGSDQQVQLAVNRCFSTCNPAASPTDTPRLKFALLQNGGGVTATEYPISANGDVVGPTIFGHNGDADALSVGAIRFNTTTAPEKFSSRGPLTYYFGPANGMTPAAPIAPPQTIHKPDIVATDGGASTFFGSCVGDAWRFYGTSAAAPHAAAVAALELDASNLSATPSQIKQAQTGTAHSVGSGSFVFGADAVGAGLIDANAAVGQILGTGPGAGTGVGPGFPPPSCTPVPSPPPSPPIVPSNANSTKAPETSFAKRPRKVVGTRGPRAFVSFRFHASEKGVTFLCAVDGGLFHTCGKKLSRWFSLGAHTVRVAARDVDGNLDQTPAVYRFRVVRIG